MKAGLLTSCRRSDVRTVGHVLAQWSVAATSQRKSERRTVGAGEEAHRLLHVSQGHRLSVLKDRAQDVGARIRQDFLPKNGERLDVPTSFLGANFGHQDPQGRKLGVLRPSRLVQIDKEVLNGFVQSGAVPSLVDEGIPPEWTAASALALQVGRARRRCVMDDLDE